MGRDSGSGGEMSKKAKFVGSFFTSVCDESVYLPAIVSSLNRRVERTRRVRVTVDARELSVKRLRLLGGAKTERTPIRLLCVAHMCVTVPELVVFVVLVEPPQRYKIMAFLCKKSRDANELVEATLDAKFLADHVVGRVDALYDESASNRTVGGRRRRFYSDGSLSGDDCIAADYDDDARYVVSGGGDYRVVELAGVAAGEPQRSQRRGTALSERGVSSSSSHARRGWSRSVAKGSDVRYYDGPDDDVVFRPMAATAPRSYTAKARRSRSVTDLVFATGGGGGGGGARRSRDDGDLAVTDDYSSSPPATFASSFTRPSAAAQYHRRGQTSSRGGGGDGGRPLSAEPQWVYSNGSGIASVTIGSDVEKRHSRAFATRSRKFVGSQGSEGSAASPAIGRYNSLSYSAASEPAAVRARSLSSAMRSSDSSADDLPAEARVTTVRRRTAASAASSSSSPKAVQAEVYAVPQARRGRQQGSIYATATLPDRLPARRQYA